MHTTSCSTVVNEAIFDMVTNVDISVDPDIISSSSWREKVTSSTMPMPITANTASTIVPAVCPATGQTFAATGPTGEGSAEGPGAVWATPAELVDVRRRERPADDAACGRAGRVGAAGGA